MLSWICTVRMLTFATGLWGRLYELRLCVRVCGRWSMASVCTMACASLPEVVVCFNRIHTQNTYVHELSLSVLGGICTALFYVYSALYCVHKGVCARFMALWRGWCWYMRGRSAARKYRAVRLTAMISPNCQEHSHVTQYDALCNGLAMAHKGIFSSFMHLMCALWCYNSIMQIVWGCGRKCAFLINH